MYIYSAKSVHLTGMNVWLSLVDFVLTSVNAEFTGVCMEIATRGLSVIIRAWARVVTPNYRELLKENGEISIEKKNSKHLSGETRGEKRGEKKATKSIQYG